MFFQNKYLRYVAMSAYRLYANNMSGNLESKVFINSTPKAGTHLITKFFDCVPDIISSGIHIQTFRVNELGDNPFSNNKFKLDEQAFQKLLSQVRQGQYVTAHLPYSKRITEILNENKFKVLFLDRDKTDLFFSELFYVRGLKRHYLHEYLASQSLENAAKLLLNGFETDEGCSTLSFKDRMMRFNGWLDDHYVSSYKFENLLGESRNGDDQIRFDNFRSILEFVECSATDDDLNSYISEFQKAGTFTMRKGKAGSWKEDILTFSPEAQKLILDNIS